MLGMHFTDPKDTDPIQNVDRIRLWDCGVTWKDIHISRTEYNWNRLDSLMDKYSGKRITYVICSTPSWVSMDPNAPHSAPWLGPGTNSLPSDIDAFNEFVWNLSKRYAGRIESYEIWNEPQLADFLWPYEKKELNRLALMTKRAYKTIKANDPKALVGSASVLPRKSSGGMKKANKYLLALQEKNWPVDFIACHIYPTPGERMPEWKAYLKDVKQAVKSLGGPSKTWCTETTFNLLGPAISDAEAAELINALCKQKMVIHFYSFNRPDLGGLQMTPGSRAWKANK